MIRFIDVSMHDRNRRGAPLDWAAIRAAGFGDVAIARTTYGDPGGFNPSSPYADEMLLGAKAAGYPIRIGYHNLIHGDQNGINRQVDYLRRRLDECHATSGMADIEPYDELKSNGLWPRWDDVQRFHDRWYALDQRPMMWYISRWVWSGWLGLPDLRRLRGPLTNASYGNGYAPSVAGWASYGNRVPNVLQYTSTANVPGASGATDANAFNGSLAEFASLLNTPVSGATPPPVSVSPAIPVYPNYKPSDLASPLVNTHTNYAHPSETRASYYQIIEAANLICEVHGLPPIKVGEFALGSNTSMEYTGTPSQQFLRVTDTRRPLASPFSYHMDGRAADIAALRGTYGDALMRDFAQAVLHYANYFLEVFHSTPYAEDDGFYVKDGVIVSSSWIGDDVVSTHFDHDHLAATYNAMVTLTAALRAVLESRIPVLGGMIL